MLGQLLRSCQAIRATGILGNYPWWNVCLFLWCFLRHKTSLYTLVAWSGLRFPDRVALAEPQEQVTYRRLLEKSDTLAGALRQSLNLHPGQTVGLLCKNRIVFVEVLLACAKLGNDVLLLTTLALDALETVDMLICDDDYKALISHYPHPKIIYTSHLRDLETPLHHTACRTMWPKPSSRLLLMTSGTSGKPKVVKKHSNFSQRLAITSGLLERLQLRAGSPTLLTTPLAHGQGLATLAFCLAMAAPLYISPANEAATILKSIETHQIRVMVTLPTLLYRLLKHLQHNTKPDTHSLQKILCGSAPLSSDLATQTLEVFGPVLYNLYGASEVGIISLATPEDLARSPGSVGQVLKGLEVNISKDRQEIQLCNKHNQVIYPTGDAGFLDENGRLFLHGRVDDMLICGGQNIYPQMIEDIIRALPYIKESAVIGIPDPEYGQGLHYFLVLETETSQETILQDISKLLPKSLRPSRLSVLSELPRNHLGKLRRYALLTSQNTQMPLRA